MTDIEVVRLSRLKPGKRNRDVVRVKQRLQAEGLFDGKPNNYFGKGFISAYKLWQKHIGYNEVNGIPDEKSLTELGFTVK